MPTAGLHRAVLVTARHFFDWERLLSTYFCQLPKILSFQQCEMDATRPGILRYRAHQTELWQETCIYKADIERLPVEYSSFDAIQQRLARLAPPGIPVKKQHVLYEKVRKYVPTEYQALICPRPTDYHEEGAESEDVVSIKSNT